MSDQAAWLLAATRPSLLAFIARAIHGLTIRSRAFYGAEGQVQMVECNEAIHRLAGHMARLAHAARELDVECAESLARDTRLLSPNEIGRIQAVATSPGS